MSWSGGRAGVTAALLSALVLITSAEAASAPVSAGEFQVKAAFLVNFGNFVTWPEAAFAGPEAPFSVCVLGDHPFGAAFEPLRKARIGGRPLSVRTVDSAPEVREGCHIVFISQSERLRLTAVLQALEPTPILTVSDLEGFAEVGGMIQLFTKGDKIRFAINRAVAEDAGLKLDARLLSLAEAAPRRGPGDRP